MIIQNRFHDESHLKWDLRQKLEIQDYIRRLEEQPAFPIKEDVLFRLFYMIDCYYIIITCLYYENGERVITVLPDYIITTYKNAERWIPTSFTPKVRGLKRKRED